MALDNDASNIPPQRPRKRSRSRQSTVEPSRSRSNTSSSKLGRRPRSRGSTASIHSCTTQYNPDQPQVPEGYQSYARPQYAQGQPVYHPNPEDIIMRIGDQLVDSNPAQMLDPALQENHNSVRPHTNVHYNNPPTHHNHTAIGNQALPPGPPPHNLRPDISFPPNYPSIFDGVENQMPDRPVEENEGVRKKRGATSSIANDNELRRLLRQYDGYNLHQMATEVRKHEGAGGKSEKVKQVFAMIWLQENCYKSGGSVRRDRVYCCYAENCGNERVSVLNPASFGKLVRIIFPNVQTRRLGVRGESKYHYVDLSIIGQDAKAELDAGDGLDKSINTIPDHSTGDSSQNRSSMNLAQQSQQSQQQQEHQPQQLQRLTERPSEAPPSSRVSPTNKPSPPTNDTCSCGSSSNQLSESIMGVDLPTVKTQLKLQQILRLGSTDDAPANDSDALKLPSIQDYLPPNLDPSVADALTALYRSHCTSVIDSFRYCKERNLFRHFSAFQGTLTVPVHKLLVHPDIAAWVEECDWLMYQKMVAFVAPLTTQIVPDPVLKAFRSISRNLVSHISETLKSQPEHVSLARIMPARLFCQLLKRMLDVNQSANAAAAWLCHGENRNKMWEEFTAFVEPAEMVMDANIPPCSVKKSIVILKEHVKSLLYPLDNCPAPQVELFDQDPGFQKFTYGATNTDEYTNFPDRWISFILQLPALFPHHSAKGMVEKADALWTSILHRLTLAGAQSFSAWWMTKVFFLEMMQWEAEKGGFMHFSPRDLRQISPVPTKRTAGQIPPARSTPDGSRSNSDKTTPTEATTQVQSQLHNTIITTPDNSRSRHSSNDPKPHPSPDTYLETSQRSLNNDDSAIAMDDDSVLSTHKYADITVSDPVDAEGEVIVV